jgi:hypothetical protein
MDGVTRPGYKLSRLKRLNRHGDIQDVLRTAANHTAHGRHIQEIAPDGERHIVFAGGPVVGRVKVQPLT